MELIKMDGIGLLFIKMCQSLVINRQLKFQAYGLERFDGRRCHREACSNTCCSIAGPVVVVKAKRGLPRLMSVRRLSSGWVQSGVCPAKAAACRAAGQNASS